MFDRRKLMGWFGLASLFPMASAHADEPRPLSPPLMTDDKYTFMAISVKDEGGHRANEKFFVGRLPNVGEAVEMVYVGDNQDGDMRFQLQVRR